MFGNWSNALVAARIKPYRQKDIKGPIERTEIEIAWVEFQALEKYLESLIEHRTELRREYMKRDQEISEEIQDIFNRSQQLRERFIMKSKKN